MPVQACNGIDSHFYFYVTVTGGIRHDSHNALGAAHQRVLVFRPREEQGDLLVFRSALRNLLM